MTAQIKPLRPASSPPPRSPEREALAAAIAALATIDDELADVRAAAGRLADDQYAFHRAVDAAEAALKQAHADEPHRLVDEALGRKTTVLTVDAATAALAVAERRVADGRRAGGLVQQEIERIETGRGYAITRVERARVALLAASPEVAALLVGHDAAIRRLQAIDAALATLPPGVKPQNYEGFAHLSIVEPDMQMRDAWTVAVAALAHNADTPLPPIEIGRIERVVVDPAS